MRDASVNKTKGNNVLARKPRCPPLHHAFEALVDDYAVSAKMHAGEVAIESDVLADLVGSRWRPVTQTA